MFTSRKVVEFPSEIGFKLLTSTPYYAQANGLVEAANKIMIGLIKKHIGKREEIGIQLQTKYYGHVETLLRSQLIPRHFDLPMVMMQYSL